MRPIMIKIALTWVHKKEVDIYGFPYIYISLELKMSNSTEPPTLAQ